MKKNLLLLSFFCLISCNQNDHQEGFSISGKWKDVKSQNEYEKDKKEGLIEIYQVGEFYEGKIISLDFPLEGENEIRKCLVCNTFSNTPIMLLGTVIIKDLNKKSDYYAGKLYDVYNRKWLDLKITKLNETQINLRIYAYLSLFGKNIVMEKGEEFYNRIVQNEATTLEKNKNLYAVLSGDGISEEGFISTINETREGFMETNMGYFYNEYGKLLDSVTFLKIQNGKKIYKLNGNISINSKGSIIYFYNK